MPTSTRAVLRRAICQELHMPFIRRTNGYGTVATTPAPTSTSFADATLTQEQDFWKNQWWYNIRSGDVRLVTRFAADTNVCYLESPVSSAILVASAGPPVVAADTYELHSVFNAYEIHAAIDRAIEYGYPSFFDVVTDETLILKEDTLAYTISGLTNLPWIPTKLWLEVPTSVMRGTATSGGVTSLVDTAANFTGVNSSYLVSIYAGTGAGQLRSVATLTGTTQINISLAWTTNPDSTSKYAVWNPTDQRNDWRRLQAVRFNTKENPTIMYLTENYDSLVGCRLRLEYISKPISLTTESSTTIVPKEFIIHQAIHFLADQKINDNRADRSRYELLSQKHLEQAELYRQSHAFNMPEITLWTPVIGRQQDYGIDGDPLHWRGY